MKVLVGSYEKGIYEVKINLKNKKFISSENIINVNKASYLINDLNLSYIYLKDNLQYIKLGNEEVLLNEGSCHLSYDYINNNVYTSYYGDGLLKVLSFNNKWFVNQTFKYPSGSHIHFAKYLEKEKLVSVIDLGLNAIYFYKNNNNLLYLDQTFKFSTNYGPRHLVENKDLNIIYVLSELIPYVFVLKYENNKWQKMASYKLENGAGSAIRITTNNKYLFAAVRNSNLLYHFKINIDGTLSMLNYYFTYGDHPRDFNIIDDKFIVIANMHSNNLTLYEIFDEKLILRDKDFYLLKGATVISYK